MSIRMFHTYLEVGILEASGTFCPSYLITGLSIMKQVTMVSRHMGKAGVGPLACDLRGASKAYTSHVKNTVFRYHFLEDLSS
jgi:hypothetical protein